MNVDLIQFAYDNRPLTIEQDRLSDSNFLINSITVI
jgi:hypothetical protein